MSFKIAKVFSQHQKPFSDGKTVKECVTAFAKSKWLQAVQSVSDMFLSHRTIVRRLETMSSLTKYQIKVKVNHLEFYCLL